jgi:hypothetical protein
MLALVLLIENCNCFTMSTINLKVLSPSPEFIGVNHRTRPQQMHRNRKEGLIGCRASITSIAQAVVGLPVMYGIMSLNEYLTHRYYQHNEIGQTEIYKQLRENKLIPKIDGGGHVEHHAETFDDMSLKIDDEAWMRSPPAQRLNEDPWRGTAFTWAVTAMMIAQCIPTTYPIFHLLGWSVLETTALFLPAMILHGLVWNALHPHMHGLPDVPASVGLPSSLLAPLRSSPAFAALWENHAGHHVASGRANYNVCCPGVDFLAGTAMPRSEWEPKVRHRVAKELRVSLADLDAAAAAAADAPGPSPALAGRP